MSLRTNKATLFFRLAGVLKILFLVFALLLQGYRNRLLKEDAGHGFLSGINIEFPWYFYFLIYTIIALYFLSITLTNITAWWPCSAAGKFYHRKKAEVWILAVEILLFLTGCFAAVVQIKESFKPRDSNLVERVFNFLLDTKNADEFNRIDKMEGINFLITVTASLLVLIFFRRMRKTISDQCAENKFPPAQE